MIAKLTGRYATPTTAVVGVVVVVVLGLVFGPDAYTAGIVIETLFWMAAASAWNLLGGYTGMNSLGHALFIGMAGFITIFFVNNGVAWWWAALIAIAITTVIGTALLFPGFRLRGPFFSLATFALPLIATTVATYWKDFTGGAQGVSWPINPSVSQFVFVGRGPYIYVIGGIAVLAVTLSVAIGRGGLGRRMRAVADDQDAAAASGVNPTRTRLIATLLSISLSAFAGSFYVAYLAFIDPTSAFELDTSLKVVLIAILGGLGRAYGAVIGALILIPVDSWLAGSFPGGLHIMLYGCLLVVLVLFLPQGVIGGVSDLARRIRTGRSGAGGKPAETRETVKQR